MDRIDRIDAARLEARYLKGPRVAALWVASGSRLRGPQDCRKAILKQSGRATRAFVRYCYSFNDDVASEDWDFHSSGFYGVDGVEE